MTQTPADERFWWDTLEGVEVERNTAGDPPYDVDAAYDFILGELGPIEKWSWLLDLGCGTGRLTNEFGRRIPNVVILGFDIAPSMLERARVNAPDFVNYYLCDGRLLPRGLGGFRGAWSVTVFQHLPPLAQQGYLREVHDVLRPGGRFVFTFSEGDEKAFLSHQVHPDDMVRWCLDAGFRVERITRNKVVHGWTWITAKRLG